MPLAPLLLAAQISTSSPDGSLSLSVADDGRTFSVSRRSEQLIVDSPLGLDLSESGPIEGLKLQAAVRHAVRRTLPLIATKALQAPDIYNATRLVFQSRDQPARILTLEVRAYNDGVAFRYVLPADVRTRLRGELTAFRFGADLSCYASEYVSSHENDWKRLKLSEMDRAKTYDIPVVCASQSGRSTMAIAQSGVEGYTSSGLTPTGDGLRVKLSSPPGATNPAYVSDHGVTSAWRVVMVGDQAGDLIPSHLIGNLARQPAGDYSWVRPGKAAWDWWSGPTAGEKPTMERYRRFIDFAAQNRFPYFLIDAGWAYNASGCCDADPKTDITRSDPAIDMPALVAYAKARGVGLILWVHWKHIEPRMETVLARYAEWGVKGIKVDFMERDDQEMVAFYARLARETASRHLLLDMHGAFPPSGLSRTYPNFITQEGVLGAEYDKFPTKRITASHNVHLAYTRMLLGPMDYTPGGFRNGLPETYAPTEVMPSTQTRRGQALAMYVVYDSPLQMVSDDPAAYRNADGFEVLRDAPTHWDETRFVGGTPDSYAALARRRNSTWYIGVMNNEKDRTVDTPLAFLPAGKFNAQIWTDGVRPTELIRSARVVDRKTVLKLDVKGSGGAVIILTPSGLRRGVSAQ